MATNVDSVITEENDSGNVTDRENLDRLLKIFNGGTGVNLGDIVSRVVIAQETYDTPEAYLDRLMADRIVTSFKNWRCRNDEDTIRRVEEAKQPVRVAQHGREEGSITPRKVTINDRKPVMMPHITQRVKTFYMDPGDIRFSKRDTVLIPNEGTKSARARSMIGGTPITRETAIALRKITIGTTVHSLSRDWRKSALVFQDSSTKYPYGFHTHQNGSRAFILCFQGYLLKNLMFGKTYASSLAMKNSLQPNDFERRKALCSAICDVLWQAGGRSRCCICLQQDQAFFDTDYTYRVDGITEKLNLYEFKKYQDLEIFTKRHLSHFEHENTNGCILLLYSVILSRTINRIIEDAGITENDEKFKLLTDNEECTTVLINLLLTGRAVPYYHNGNIIYDKDGHLLPTPLRGLKERSQVGLLFWDRNEEPDERTEIGSMLKTPKNPIWLTLINGHYGVLYSNNIDLVSDWRVEHHFTLHYYTGSISKTYTVLTIETLRVPEEAKKPPPEECWGNTRYTRRFRCKTGLVRKVEEEKIPPLEQCILTKWYGANIDWHGTFPFY
ncbi:FAM188B2-like [Mactra antiquata]